MMAKNITQDDVFAEIVTSIEAVAEAAQQIKNSKLKARTIHLLIKDATGIPLMDIEKVLDAAADLKKKYLK